MEPIMKIFSLASLAPLFLVSQLFAQAATQAPTQSATQAATQAATWPKNEAGLTALATSLVTNWVAMIAASDVPAIESCMQPCIQVVTFSGAVDRAGNLVLLKSLVSKAPTVSAVIATRVGDALVTTCLVSITQTLDGKSLTNSEVPRIGVWQIVDGGWKLAAWATLNMPEVRPAPSAPAFAGDPTLNAEGAAMVTKFLTAQHAKDMPAFEAMLADGMQVVNFKGQKVRADMIKGAKAATTSAPVVADARTTRCGDLTIVTCNLSMSQKVAFNTLPADPAPFLAVLQGSGSSAKVIALANTNKPK